MRAKTEPEIYYILIPYRAMCIATLKLCGLLFLLLLIAANPMVVAITLPAYVTFAWLFFRVFRVFCRFSFHPVSVSLWFLTWSSPTALAACGLRMLVAYLLF